MTDAAPPPQGLGHPTRVLITLAAAGVAFAAMYAARGIIGPIVLAVVLVIIAHPVRAWLERKGWPRWAATTAVIVVAYLILAVLGFLLVLALGQFVRLAADSTDEFAALAGQLVDWLASIGFDTAQATDAAAQLDPSTFATLLIQAGSSLLSSATAIVLVFAYILFMAADAACIPQVFERFGDSHGRVIAALGQYATGVRRYMVVNAVFGAIVAVLDGLLLWALVVPGAFVWAVLAFITNFIPNIGFVIGVIPPAAMALLVGGWPLALAVVAIYCVINVTLQVLVQPRFVAVAVNLGFTITFASVIFWSFVLGAIGALMAVPLTLLLKLLLLDPDPRGAWARALAGDRTPEEAPPSREADDGAPALPGSHPAP